MNAEGLRNYETWRESLRNFEWLEAAVPGASDIDFICERKKNFLIIEAKPWLKGIEVPYGQHLLLSALAEQPRTRVYLVGEDGDRWHVSQYGVRDPIVTRTYRLLAWWPADRFIPTDREGLRSMVAGWWEDASNGNLQ